MKTATITWITYNNYGTQLQAYALQQYLLACGVENVIIDDGLIVRGEFCNSKKVIDKKKIKNSQNIFDYLHIIKKKAIKYTQKKFGKKNIFELSNNKYKLFKERDLSVLVVDGITEYENLNKKFDLFICGSDQIWSVLDRNFKGFYFLDFVTVPKISYAASVGTTKITETTVEQIGKWLQSFLAISVRESETAKQFSSLYGKEIKCVVDPTLLHDAYFWAKFSKKTEVKVHGKYILCYFIENKDWYFSYADKLAELINAKVVLLPSRKEYLDKRNVLKKPVGPKEFVSLIKNASFVLTDSYHGSIFSLLFNKEFLYLLRFRENDPECQNIRIYSLFQKLNLINHIIAEKDFDESDMCRTEYSIVNLMISKMKKESQGFILDCLSHYGKCNE